MSLKIKTAPTVEVLSYEDVIDHLRIDDTSRINYEMINRMIIAIRKSTEDYLNRALITQTWYYYLGSFPSVDYIELPKPPLQSVTSLKYTLSTGGAATTWNASNYIVNEVSSSQPGRITLTYGNSWPSDTLYPTEQAIEIEYVCGYGADYTYVPEEIIQAMLIGMGEFWENRERFSDKQMYELPTYKRLLFPYRIIPV